MSWNRKSICAKIPSQPSPVHPFSREIKFDSIAFTLRMHLCNHFFYQLKKWVRKSIIILITILMMVWYQREKKQQEAKNYFLLTQQNQVLIYSFTPQPEIGKEREYWLTSYITTLHIFFQSKKMEARLRKTWMKLSKKVVSSSRLSRLIVHRTQRSLSLKSQSSFLWGSSFLTTIMTKRWEESILIVVFFCQ